MLAYLGSRYVKSWGMAWSMFPLAAEQASAF